MLYNWLSSGTERRDPEGGDAIPLRWCSASPSDDSIIHSVQRLLSQADAQLAYLSRNGMVDAVLTEDSDLMAFGCPRVLFKLEPDGSAQQVRGDNDRDAIQPHTRGPTSSCPSSCRCHV